jgi:hypothetical protein
VGLASFFGSCGHIMVNVPRVTKSLYRPVHASKSRFRLPFINMGFRPSAMIKIMFLMRNKTIPSPRSRLTGHGLQPVRRYHRRVTSDWTGEISTRTYSKYCFSHSILLDSFLRISGRRFAIVRKEISIFGASNRPDSFTKPPIVLGAQVFYRTELATQCLTRERHSYKTSERPVGQPTT